MTALPVPLSEVGPERVRRFLRGLPYHDTDWDETLRPKDHVALAEHRLAEIGKEGHGWATVDSGRVTGVAAMRALGWDTDYFGVPMAALEVLRAADERHLDVLLGAVAGQAAASGVRHTRHMLDARGLTELRALHRAGWRVAWGIVRVVALTRRVERDSFPLRRGPFEVVETRPAHHAALLEAAGRLSPYNWLEHETALPAGPRRRYVLTRVRQCLEGKFADICVTLLHRGRPVGCSASRLAAHPRVGREATAFVLQVENFVAPDAVPGCGEVLARGVLARVRPRARFVLGRTRLGGDAMLRVLLGLGFAVSGGEYCVVREAPPSRGT